MAPEIEVTEALLRKPSQEIPRSEVARPTRVGRQTWGCHTFCWSDWGYVYMVGSRCPHLSCASCEGPAHRMFQKVGQVCRMAGGVMCGFALSLPALRCDITMTYVHVWGYVKWLWAGLCEACYHGPALSPA